MPTLPLLLFVVVLALMLMGGYVVRNILPLSILRPGYRKGTTTPADFGLTYEHLRLPVAPQVELDSFFVPATTTPLANLIILHGVGSCKEVYLPLAENLCALGYNLFLFDQRVHGKSGGQYLTYGYREKADVSKIIDWLADKTDNLRTGIYGNSMGGAVALQSLDHDHRLAFGLIESTFTDLPAVTRAYARRTSLRQLPAGIIDLILRQAGRLAHFDPWAVRPIDAAARLHQPVQFIHGDADSRIGYQHAKQLFAACTSVDKQLYLVPRGDHADLWEAGGTAYAEVWYGFLKRMATFTV